MTRKIQYLLPPSVKLNLFAPDPYETRVSQIVYDMSEMKSMGESSGLSSALILMTEGRIRRGIETESTPTTIFSPCVSSASRPRSIVRSPFSGLMKANVAIQRIRSVIAISAVLQGTIPDPEKTSGTARAARPSGRHPVTHHTMGPQKHTWSIDSGSGISRARRGKQA